jgi:HEPN domain-containing protein
VSKQSDPLEWLRFAQADLSAARTLLREPDLPPRLACFHAHQGGEKALKASLIQARTPFRKTHDLVVLVALQPDTMRSALSSLDLQQLQQWAVDARYPGDLPGVTTAEAKQVLAIAEQILDVVATALGDSGPH